MSPIKITLLLLISITFSYSRINNRCKQLEDCHRGLLKDFDRHYVCYDGLCKCEANYQYNHTEQSCQKFNCKNDYECQEYDPNRKCTEDCHCVCKEELVEDPRNGRKCNPYVLPPPDKCRTAVDCRGKNFRCIDNKCQCLAGHKLVGNHCEKVNCYSDPDCYTSFDRHRVCKQQRIDFIAINECVCRPGYVENNLDERICVKDRTDPEHKNRFKISFDGWVQIA